MTRGDESRGEAARRAPFRRPSPCFVASCSVARVPRRALLASCLVVATLATVVACAPGPPAVAPAPPAASSPSASSSASAPVVRPNASADAVARRPPLPPDPPNGRPGASTPLHAAAKTGDRDAVARLLAASPGDVDAPDPRGLTPLHHASSVSLDVVKLLLVAGANPNARSVNGTTPLYVAARFGQTAIASQLLSAGALVDGRGEGGAALNAAAYRSPVELVELLLAKGADVRVVDDTGGTALHAAAVWNAEGAARALLAAGASVNAVDKEGNTPLHATTSFASTTSTGSVAVARLLLAAGARLTANAAGRTPVDLAEAKGATGLADVLRGGR